MRTPRQPGSPPDDEDKADGGHAKERLKQFERQRGLPPGKGSTSAPAPQPAPPPKPGKKR